MSDAAVTKTAKVALITGANKGIGLETARQLGKLGVTIIVGARDLAKGEQAAEVLPVQWANPFDLLFVLGVFDYGCEFHGESC